MVAGDVTTGTEVLVIGGGPGGYVAGIRAGQLGHEVTLVEAAAVGGTCLNDGCIPSKALISATDVAHRAGAAERLGVHADPAVDLAAMVGWKDRLVGRLTDGVESLLEGAGATVIEGRAELNSGEEARVVHDGEGQGSETVSFEHAVVATGSRPVELPTVPFDGDRVLSSRGALGLETVPESLAVVGAGYIGMELATVYAKLGADVTVLEQLADALPGYDDDLTEVVRERAAEVGVDFRFGAGVEGCEPRRDEVRLETGDGAVTAERCLVAVGREPVTDTAGLGAAGVETDDGGFVVTDEQGRTTRGNIFAVGDVAGEPMLAHAAFREGEVAAEAVDGQPAALDSQAVPAAVFTDPEIATVGLTEAEAREAGFEPAVGEMPLRASGRALTLDEREGFVRVVADSEHGFMLGAQVVGPEASELIAEPTLAIEMGATLEDVAATIHTHPTLSEAVMEAAEGALDRSVHY